MQHEESTAISRPPHRLLLPFCMLLLILLSPGAPYWYQTTIRKQKSKLQRDKETIKDQRSTIAVNTMSGNETPDKTEKKSVCNTLQQKTMSEIICIQTLKDKLPAHSVCKGNLLMRMEIISLRHGNTRKQKRFSFALQCNRGRVSVFIIPHYSVVQYQRKAFYSLLAGSFLFRIQNKASPKITRFNFIS